MRPFPILALVGGLVLLVATGESHGITFVDVSGFKDPDAKMIPADAKVFVFVRSGDVELRCALEKSLVGELREKASREAVSSCVLFPPTREPKSEETLDALLQSGLTHVFSIVPGERRVVGDTVRMDFKVEIKSLDAGPMLWVGTAKARLVTFADAADVADEVSEELVAALSKYGILPPRKRKSARH